MLAYIQKRNSIRKMMDMPSLINTWGSSSSNKIYTNEKQKNIPFILLRAFPFFHDPQIMPFHRYYDYCHISDTITADHPRFPYTCHLLLPCSLSLPNHLAT